jgi:S-adenosylmethionine:tRNA ribosyltransferase-isomerase
MSTGEINLQNYEYALPEKKIAQYPAENRENAKLCILHGGKIVHERFSRIVDFLESGDCLVLNNTKVIPARLLGQKKTGAGVEVFLLEQLNDFEWITIGRPGKHLKKGNRIYFEQDIHCEVLEDDLEEGRRHIRFSAEKEALFGIGSIPLPPYVKRQAEESDACRYQTVYASKAGAVAAHTAGLHFTADILDCLAKKGVATAFITLHVGLGTFRPVSERGVSAHRMEKEFCEIDQKACDIINRTKERGGRIIAAGTTVVKTLETAAQRGVPLLPFADKSNLFIYPPFVFKTVDGMVTNFHMPRSTLLLLVSAFAGHENIMRMYKEALKNGYRFLSYGDATLLLE